MNNNQSKERIRRRYKDAYTEGVEVIPAKEKNDPFDETSDMNVVVYVRVSTDNAQQTSSFEMQQKYYSDFVKRHPSWKLIRIYADEGISGTSLKKRDEFKRMIEDCKKGGIDLIVTKNVSRWSRNILDGIGIVRELEALNPPVGVFFENEGLYSLNPENATLLQINSTMAEHESRTKSTSMISSLMMRFSHGLFLTPPLLGYDNDEDGGLVINREEAATVRLIFFMYLYGCSTDEIANALMKYGRTTKPGNVKWTSSTVISILRNERHCGDVLAWKSYTPSFLNHKKAKNHGDMPQFYKRGHHEPIISRDDFITVQQMLNNAKYGNNGFLPRLRVNTDGLLCGFVSVNTRWASFTADDYRKAPASVLS